MYDWADYLNVADALLTQVGGEGAERSAISRAYYACYGKASQYARAKNAPLTGARGDHTALWNWFLAETGPGSIDIRTRVSANGKRLKQWRIVADYQDVKRNVPKITRNALVVARSLLDDLASLP